MPNPPIQVDYNCDLTLLEDALFAVDRPGDYYVAERLELPPPTVKVDGIGTLSFPVPAFQVDRLIERATRAPYGRGEETIIDTTVRQVWQISADKVSVGGKYWKRSFETILGSVAGGLGCDRAQVSADLYKLLVYEPEGFFKPHRDTEKSEGMFGTLVLVLPSEHSGGEMVIRHGNREARVDLSGSDLGELAFAALYADCEHQVLPLTSGHRICLGYNLVHPSVRGKNRLPEAPLYESESSRAASALEEALAAKDGPLKIVWLLEHQYSPAGLSFDALKNADAARTKVLTQAASRAGCVAHLGIVHIEEYGMALPIYDPDADREYARYGGDYYDDNDDEEYSGEDEDDAEDFEVVEVTDGKQFVDEWIDSENRGVSFGPIPLKAGEIVPAGALDEEPADRQRVTEATGNEGASFERSYRRGAVVIWHRRRYPDVLLQAGVGAAVPYLTEQVAACEVEPGNAGLRRETLAVVGRMMDRWQSELEAHGWRRRYGLKSAANPSEMLDLLIRLGDARSIESFVGRIVTEAYDGGENAALTSAMAMLTASRARDLLSGVVTKKMRALHIPCIDLLSHLVRFHDAGGLTPAARWKTALVEVAECLVDGLRDVARPSPTPDFYGYEEGVWAQPKMKPPVRSSPDPDVALADLLGSLRRLEPELAGRAVSIVAENLDAFDPVKVVVPALVLLGEREGARASRCAGFSGLWRHAARFLLDRSEQPPERPKDWRQGVTVGCSCPDCRELKRFARDPQERIHRFAVRKDRRRHLHDAIKQGDLDMTHVTEHKGSPHTLVCTKTRRGFERRLAQYRNDLAAMAALVGMPPHDVEPVSVKLAAALDRGERYE